MSGRLYVLVSLAFFFVCACSDAPVGPEALGGSCDAAGTMRCADDTGALLMCSDLYIWAIADDCASYGAQCVEANGSAACIGGSLPDADTTADTQNPEHDMATIPDDFDETTTDVLSDDLSDNGAMSDTIVSDESEDLAATDTAVPDSVATDEAATDTVTSDIDSEIPDSDTISGCITNSDCDDPTPLCLSATHTCVDNAVYFSEYIEGSSNNKALEVYNGSAGAIDPSKYRIRLFANGASASAPTVTSVLNACGTITILDSGALLTIANSSAASTLTKDASCTLGVTNYNGDDAVTLEYTANGSDWAVIDQIGVVGTDPGTAWDVAGVANATADHTLVRKATITTGTTDWVSSAGTSATDSQWTLLEKDDFSSFGSR